MYGNTLVIVNPTARSGKAEQAAHQAKEMFSRLAFKETSLAMPNGATAQAKARPGARTKMQSNAQTIANAATEKLPGAPAPDTQATFRFTTSPHDATKIARAEGASFDTLIVIGGDGVLHETVQGLMQLPPEERPQLGLVPCGNGDDFARSAKLPRKPAQALAMLEQGALIPHKIDLLKVNDSYCLETLSFGLDAAIALGAQELRTKTSRTGTSLYIQCAADQLLHHLDIHQVRLSIDGKTPRKIKCYLLAVQNGVNYGGGFQICPDAKLDDGYLDICYATPTLSLAQGAWIFAKAKFGKHIHHPHLHFLRAKSADLSFGEEGDATMPPSQIDGERFSDPKIHLEVLPHELTMLMPRP